MELEIQTLLRKHGLDYVKEMLVLEVKERDNLVLLKYNTLGADWTQTALYDCRGIILDREDNWNVVAYPYRKFFNIGEGYCAKLDWNNVIVFEKADGTLITLWYYKGKWEVSTSGTIYADQLANEAEYTFAELFWNAVKLMYGSKEEFISNLDTNYNYMFELCTPFNIIVTQHQESKTFLHGVRDMRTWKELLINDFDYFHKVKTRSLKSVDEMTNSFENMTWQEEGYVALDLVSMERGKLKNPAYVSAHHISSGMSPYHIIEVIKKNEISEFCLYFKERSEFIHLLKSRWDVLEGKLYFEWTNILQSGNFPTQKEFALEVLSEIKKPFHGIMFQMKTGKLKSIREGMCALDNKFLYYYLQEN